MDLFREKGEGGRFYSAISRRLRLMSSCGRFLNRGREFRRGVLSASFDSSLVSCASCFGFRDDVVVLNLACC